MDVLKTLQKLPPMCAALHPSEGEPIFIKRGVMGYFPAVKICPQGFAKDVVDHFNKSHGITDAQVQAMEIGSAFGWDVPGADPDVYTEKATPEVRADASAWVLGEIKKHVGGK